MTHANTFRENQVISQTTKANATPRLRPSPQVCISAQQHNQLKLKTTVLQHPFFWSWAWSDINK
jgi:hypothetical protein